MHRGVIQSYLVQQMMGGSSNWWSMNNMRPPPEQASSLLPSSSVFLEYPQASNFFPMTPWHDNEDLSGPCSQLLLGGLAGEEERCTLAHFQARKTQNLGDHVRYTSASANRVGLKQEISESGCVYSHGSDIQASNKSPWTQVLPASFPGSCVTTGFGSNMLDFTKSKGDTRYLQPDHSSECNSTAIGSAFKKARIQGPPSGKSTFKVRKEKLGDRITALHQLVSPFGKTDTASVLLEAIGYIRFLQSQIEVQALSTPYLASGFGNMRQPVQGDGSCIFPEDLGQLLTDNGMKKREPPDQGVNDEPKKDLRSRGLCLVPVSFTMHIGSDNGADYWASALGGGFP